MTSAQTNNAQATNRSTEHNGNGDFRSRGAAQKSDVYQPTALCDDDRLIRLDSTIAAAEAERASLQKRIAEKALLKNLQAELAETIRAKQAAETRASVLEQERNDVIQARQRDEVVFKDKLYASQHEVQGLNTTLAGLNSELHAREDELSQFKSNNQKMVNEIESVRVQNGKLQRALAKEITKVEDLEKRHSEHAFRQTELAEMAEENDSFKSELQDQANTIRRLQAQIDRHHFQERQVASQRAVPVAPSMYGPVGAPCSGYPPADHSFYQGYPPHSQLPVPPSAPMAYMTSRPMPTMSMGYAPAPPPVYHFPQSLSANPSQQVFDSDAGEEAYSEGGSGAVSISPRGNGYASHYQQPASQAPSNVSNYNEYQSVQAVNEPPQSELESAQLAYEPAQATLEAMHEAGHAVPEPREAAYEPVQEAYEPMQPVAQSEEAAYEVVQEAPMDGQAFLAKLQSKGTEFAETSQGSHEPSSVPAVHADLAVPAHAPSPPVQTSRSGMVSEEAAQEAAGLSGVEPDARHVPGSNVGTGNISDVQEPTQAEPLPARKAIYVTPLAPGYLASLPVDQQQNHWDAINALHAPQTSVSNSVPDLAGKYVTPMPPQSNSSSSAGRIQQSSRGNTRRQRGRGRQRDGGASRNGGGQRQGHQRGEAGHAGTQQRSGDQKGENRQGSAPQQSDAPQPQRNNARRRNRNKGNGNNGQKALA